MSYLQIIAVIIVIGSGCSKLKKDNEPQESIDNRERFPQVVEKQRLYCELSRPKYEEKGYTHSKCDGLLFTALHGMVCPYVDIYPFQQKAGLWKRSPTQDCFKSMQSRTGISGDMLLGLTFYAWHTNNLTILEDLIAYGEEHGWDMCDGEHESEKWRLGRCVVKPTLKATIYEVASKMGYDCRTRCQSARLVPQVWNPHVVGYQAHLVQLHILLRGLVQKAINDNQVDQLRWQVERVPDNALFRSNLATWTSGDMTPSVDILMNPLYFPEDRLPGSGDRCTDYLWQRDPGADWTPCEAEIAHYGTDFLLVSAIILGELRGQNGYSEP